MDDLNKVIHTFEYTPADEPGSHNLKLGVDLVHPGGSRWSEMQVKPTVSLKPFVDRYVLVSRVIIQDQVQV